MVAYIVVIHDNLASGCRGLRNLLSSSSGVDQTGAKQLLSNDLGTGAKQLLSNDLGVTLVVSLIVILPLSLLRNVSHLERFSSTKITLYVIILAIVVYMYFTLPAQEEDEDTSLSFYEKWWRITPSMLPNMGTLVCSFEAAENIHACFRSLHPSRRTLEAWGMVSSLSIGMAYVVFLALALFAYMTYWKETTSDLFLQYPQDEPIVCVGRILLSISMLLTYPMPMYATRETIFLSVFRVARSQARVDASMTDRADGTGEIPVVEETRESSDDTETLDVSLSWRLFKYTIKVRKNQIVTAGRLVTVLDMRPQPRGTRTNNNDSKVCSAIYK